VSDQKQGPSASIEHEEDYQDSGFQGLGFADRIGYSPMVGSNVFVDMRQVILVVDIIPKHNSLRL
jgi:hypothetical protein